MQSFYRAIAGLAVACFLFANPAQAAYLVDTGEVKFLLDCGMFQGGRDAERKNRAAFAFDARDIAFVLLSHAHIDHSGLLPLLVARGFRGAIYATRATCDLLGVMLPDSGHLQVEIWLSILVRKLLKRGSFTSIEQLKAKVLAFVEYYNRTMAKPFKWTYKGKALAV